MNVVLSVINANVSHCQRHKHSCWEVVYRLSGSSNTTLDNQEHRISAGDLYLIPPNVFHSDSSEHPYTDLVIHADFLDFSDVLILHDSETYIASLAQMINRIMVEKEYNYQNIANSLMDALCQYIKRLSLSVYRNPLVYKFKNILYANIENADFDLVQEIKNAGYHPDYIRRCFKAETQKTPLAYLTDLRIDRAKQLLLLHTYDGIESVAANCGFRETYYFSICFKKHTGLSPLQYRKQHLPK